MHDRTDSDSDIETSDGRFYGLLNTRREHDTAGNVAHVRFVKMIGVRGASRYIATKTEPDWLTHVYDLSRKNDIEQAAYVVADNFDRLLCSDEFTLCDRLLQQLDLSSLDPDIMVSILAATFPARDKLRNWLRLKWDVEDLLREVDSPEEVDLLMSTLVHK